MTWSEEHSDRDIYGNIDLEVGITERTANKSNGDLPITIFSGPLILPNNTKFIIYDVSGRINNPGYLKPGIYFIEIDK